MKPIIGYIPAGGRGMRMKPFRLIKELLPVYINDGMESKVFLLIENAIRVLMKGGAKDIICTINQEKEVLMHTISGFQSDDEKARFAFVYQENLAMEYGLPFAIEGASPFLKGHTVFMKFPDTIVYPLDCFKELFEFHQSKHADLTLGVFPTANPERLGPVVIDKDGKVITIEDKPQCPSARNTWNILIWEDTFLDLLVNEVNNYRKSANSIKELLIYDIFQKALDESLKVYAYEFSSGCCNDIACIDDAKNLWAQGQIRMEA